MIQMVIDWPEKDLHIYCDKMCYNITIINGEHQAIIIWALLIYGFIILMTL